jgi:oxygen-independent coproporphyrinogen-3 oxidase
MIDLLNKYNQPVPRYTSYPTVPYWTDDFDMAKWKTVFAEEFSKHNKAEGLSIYIHLPFCESLCTYCGCNKKITTNHSVEEEYMQAMMKEWQLYLALMNEKPIIRELHLGGGTPTFFSPENLKALVGAVLKDAIVHPEHEFSFEGHPNNTTREHLQALYDIGFRRVSFGVQDNDPEVQRVINRIQPFENVKRGTETAREIGYKSVNFDLIYGLPLQTKEKMENTIRQAISLKPDRVAFYSYAHVPWTSRGQRLFDENDLPGAATKMELYILGKKLFTESGYVDIGMDHFALPEDDLYIVWQEGKLHRNFMGYTTQRTGMMLGLGVSSISDAGVAFAQNHKTVHDYYESINKGELAVTKGYFLSEEDVLFRRYILDMSCNGKTVFKEAFKDRLQQYTFPELALVHADGLVNYDDQHAELTTLGRHFLRNVCRAFDLHLLRNRENKEATMPKFSKAI